MAFPVLINSDATYRGAENTSVPGPFVISATVQYAVISHFNAATGTDTSSVFKSVDAGATWVAQDEANATAAARDYSACFDGEHTLWVSFVENSSPPNGSLKIVSFDINTDTWGAVFTDRGVNTGDGVQIVNCWRSFDKRVAVAVEEDLNGPARAFYNTFNPVGSSFSTPVQLDGSQDFAFPSGMVEGPTGIIYCLVFDSQFTGDSFLRFQAVNTVDALSTSQILFTLNAFAPAAPSRTLNYMRTGNIVIVAYTGDSAGLNLNVIHVIQGTGAFNVAFGAPVDITASQDVRDNGLALSSFESTLQIFYAIPLVPPHFPTLLNSYYIVTGLGGAAVFIGSDNLTNIQSMHGVTTSPDGTGFAFIWNNHTFGNIVIPPPPVVVPVSIPFGSKGFTPPPNDYTMCLVREFHLFEKLEFSKLECCPGRECIITDYAEPVGIGYEETRDGLAFNPVNAIPLPDPTDGEVVVLSEVVPIGYDGMILAQFHGYIQSPSGTNVSSFTEGSGDIAWRITSNDRYLKDCGNMLVSIGSTQRLAPIYGGIRVRSGDTITYRVQVYNLSGLLTPGIGSIIAGLHGFFYPRK